MNNNLGLENWIKWIQVRVPLLKEKYNEFYLKRVLESYSDEVNDKDESNFLKLYTAVKSNSEGNCTHFGEIQGGGVQIATCIVCNKTLEAFG